jgi:hypothetical protein
MAAIFTIASSKEREHVRDKVSLIVVQPIPVAHVSTEIDLLWCPERSDALLVMPPNLVIANREKNESVVSIISKHHKSSANRLDRLSDEANQSRCPPESKLLHAIVPQRSGPVNGIQWRSESIGAQKILAPESIAASPNSRDTITNGQKKRNRHEKRVLFHNVREKE